MTRLPLMAKLFIFIVGLYFGVIILFELQGIILPFLCSAILAIVLQPIVHLMVKWGMNRVVAIIITMMLVLIFTAALLMLLSSQSGMFMASVPALLDRFGTLFAQTKIWISDTFNISQVQINAWIAETKLDVLENSKAWIAPTLMNFGNVLVLLFLIPVYLFMFLYYEPLLVSFVYRAFSSSSNSDVHKVLVASKKIIQSYLTGLLIESFLVAGLNISGLLILGIDYAFLMGLLGGLINVIPYVGGIVGMLLPMFIALATKAPIYALFVFLLYLFIQFIDNNIIMPYIVASKVQVNGLISVLVVILGGALWGITGMFLSIPLTAIVKVICDQLPGYEAFGFLLGNQDMSVPKQKK